MNLDRNNKNIPPLQAILPESKNANRKLSCQDDACSGGFYLGGNMKEEWSSVKGYRLIYSISNNGAVRRDKKGMGAVKGKILKPFINTHGYVQIDLFKNKKKKKHQIHRLVYINFFGNIKKGLQINHKDGNKLNNDILNLECLTNKENMEHAIRNGLTRNNVGRKLDKYKIIKIRDIYKNSKITQKQLSIMFNVCQETINDIITRKTWKSIH